MHTKRIIVLANSYKKGGRCVAGVDVGTEQKLIPNGWIRPISDQPEGTLESRHMRMADRAPIVPLDVVDVPLVRYASDTAHPEDWIIDTKRAWSRIGRLKARTIGALEEKPNNLWLEPRNRADRVTGDFLRRLPNHQSLYLIHPEELRVELTNDFNPFQQRNTPKRRVCFAYRGQVYSLGLTDPDFIERLHVPFPAPDQPAVIIQPTFGDNCLLCISLTPRFEKTGYHYKVVASVLPLP